MQKKVDPKLLYTGAFTKQLGLQFTQCGEGFSQCILEVKEDLLNLHEALHGGVSYSMADTGMGVALYFSLDETEHCATLEINMIYLSAVTSGKLICDSKLIHKNKRNAVLESVLTQEEVLVAKAMGTFSIFKPKR